MFDYIQPSSAPKPPLLRRSLMKKLPTYLILTAGLTGAPQESQGYEVPQADAYRGQAQQSSSLTNVPDIIAAERSRSALLKLKQHADNPTSARSALLKTTQRADSRVPRHFLSAVGHIANVAGRAARGSLRPVLRK